MGEYFPEELQVDESNRAGSHSLKVGSRSTEMYNTVPMMTVEE